MKKKYLLLFLLSIVYYNSYSQTSPSPTCAGATALCASSGLTFPSVTTGTAEAGINYGCLSSQPRPTWFYIKVDASGILDFTISQTSTAGNPIDVDFISWGPFTAPTCGAASLNAATIVDCSYSAAAVENFHIQSALAGEYYMVLITNYSGQAGQITLTQNVIGSPTSNGQTDCTEVCPLTINGGGVSICGASNLAAYFLHATTPTTYQWYLNGNIINGATSSTVTPTVAGTYSVIANSPNCPRNSTASTVILPPAPPATNAPADLTLCSGGPSTLFNLTANSATMLGSLNSNDYEFNYHTTLAGAQNYDSSIPNPAAYAGTDGQIIYVSILDNTQGGCLSTNQFTLHFQSCVSTPQTPPDMVVCDDPSNNGFATFTLTQQNAAILGGNNAADYNITYHLTLSDAQNDINPIGPSYTNITNPQTIYVRMEEVATPTTFGTTDFDLIVNPLPTVTVNNPVVCAGANATVTATPGTGGTYSYAWTVPAGVTAPGNVASFTTTTAGTYSVIIANTATACISASASGTVTTTPLPTVTVNNPVVCAGANATVTATPGTAGTYSYAWTVPAGATAPGDVASFSTTTAGTYTVTITNTATTCVSASASGTVTVNPLPTVTVNSPSVCLGANATVTATPGTAGAYSYAWTVPAGATAPGNVASFTTSVAGTYSVIITNTVTTCISASASGTVTINPLPTVTVNSPVVCAGASATVTANPGVPGAYSYAWSVPAGATAPGNVASFTTAIAGSYSVIITNNATTCVSASASGTVTINPLPTVTVNSPVVCAGASATVTAIPGTGGVYSYAWTVPAGAAAPGDVASFTTTTAGTYSVVITNTATTCFSSSASGIVTLNPLPTASISGTSTVCSGSGTNILFNGTPNTIVTYTINNGSNLTTTLDGSGNATLATGNLTLQTVYNLVSVTTTTAIPTCSQNLSGNATISVVNAPTIIAPTPLQVCDDNNDGFANFVLSVKDNEITAGQPGLSVTYHETLSDAQNGVAQITLVPYTNINPGTQIVYVRVFDSAAPQCPSFTTLQLIVNPRPIPNPVISNYELCDVNNPGDGVENFDLPTKTPEIVNGQTGVSVTYYETQSDAQNAASAIDTTVLYPNTGTPQQIWIRLENNATGCFSVSSFLLVVNPLPTVVTPSPMNACSNGASNFAQFNLSLNDGSISAGASNVTVSYYETLSDAQNEVSPLSNPYTNISNPQTVYVRVENNTTGCYDTTSLVLNVTQGPTAVTPTPLEVCDPNSDGFSAFDLESASAQIAGGSVPAGVVITYHETMTDAINGANALSSPYTNIIVNIQDIYVRVSYALTGCSNIVNLKLIVHNTPIATDNVSLQECDDNTDGTAIFNLTDADTDILGTLDPTQYDVTYYVLQADAQAGTNPILNVLNYSSTTQIIWVRVADKTTGCFDVVSLQLIVNPLPVVPFPVPSYSLCDYNLTGDEKEEFDLSSRMQFIIGTQTGLNVSFHRTAADALADVNALPMQFINETNAQTLHVRVENNATQCFVVTTMDLRVEPLPTIQQPTPLELTQCDLDGNGFTSFDLDALIPGILNGAPNTTVTFHETATDADTGNNALTSPYTNITAYSHQIWIRAENTLTHCYSKLPVTLHVNASPVIPPVALQDVPKCDADSNNQNGFTSFDLTLQQALAEQSNPNYSASLYTSLANAQAGTSPIINLSNFTNTSNPQTIWIVLTDSATSCLSSIGSFQLIVNTPLALTTPTALSLCDDGATTTIPTRVFDLTVKNSEILGTATGYTVTYFPSSADALAGTNAIANPTAYTNISNAQTLGVMVTSPAGCKSFTTMDIRVLPLPTPKEDPVQLALCDDVNSPNGTELFDLTQNQGYIANGDPNLSFEYYLSPQDADAQVNMITTPTSYEIGTRIIWIRVMNNQVNSSGSKCYKLVQQSLLVNPLPVVTSQPYPLCDAAIPASNTATFDLHTMDDDLLGMTDTSNYTVTYYLTAANAQSATAPLPNMYTNITNPQDIYVRVVNNTTGCVNFNGIVTLSVKPGASATSPAAPLVTCDTDYTTPNGTYTFDLTQLATEVLGGQNPAQFTVAYFASQTDALAGTGAIATPNAYATASGTIYMVVTNTTTGCKSDPVSVGVTVEPLAEPQIASSTGGTTICVSSTNVLLSGLTLDSGVANPSNYTFQWYMGGVAIAGATGNTYPITAATPTPWEGSYTVVATSTSALGCVSLPSAPFVVVQAGPAAAQSPAYTGSAYFSDNQTITVHVDGYGIYYYSIDGGPIVNNGGVFENVSIGGHDILVYDVEGDCGPALPIHVDTVNYPTYFTPNGDGYHDTWNIIGLDQPQAKIYIYDRYGKLLKQISPTSPSGWDGTFNGQMMPSSDYWFTIDYTENGASKIFKSHFSMKR